MCVVFLAMLLIIWRKFSYSSIKPMIFIAIPVYTILIQADINICFVMYVHVYATDQFRQNRKTVFDAICDSKNIYLSSRLLLLIFCYSFDFIGL